MGDLEGTVDDKSRSLYTHEEYISLVLNSGSGLSHDYVSQSEQEDPRMMAFFDSLVRREIEGWSSDSDSDLSEGAIMQLHVRGHNHTRSSNHASLVDQPPPPDATNPSDSNHSSLSSSTSSVLSGPASDNERAEPEVIRPQGRRRLRPRQTFLFDLANEDSDSSGLWVDPLVRPRSPSPRENSSLSQNSSPSSSPSSSSSSSSNSDEEEAERQRSTIRQRNASRKRCKINWAQKDSAPSLDSATDYSRYPKIAINDSSSVSSSGEENRPIKIISSKNKRRGLASSPTPGPSAAQGKKLKVRSHFTSGHNPEVLERAKSRMGHRSDSGAELDVGKSSEEEPGVNGNGSAHDENCFEDSVILETSREAMPDSDSADSRNQQTFFSVKRTRLGSDEEEEPPSEKKLKT